MNAPTKFAAADRMATPSYCAEMRRAHAKRIAREECQAALAKAYQALGDAEAEADRIYMAEMAQINADMCREWSDRREAA
jgi:hypothetical protein